jgi:hypothetical protein
LPDAERLGETKEVRGLKVRRRESGHRRRDTGIDALDRASVEHNRALDGAAGEDAVGEGPRDRGRCFRIVGEHQVGPSLVAHIAAELPLQFREQIGVGRLAAAAGTEDRADEGRHGDHVACRDVRLINVVRVVIAIDAVGVRPGIGHDLNALRTVRLLDEGDLGID